MGTGAILALNNDLIRAAQDRGIESINAAIVSTKTSTNRPVWLSLTGTNNNYLQADALVNNAIHAAVEALRNLPEADAKLTLVQRLGPYRWLLAWRAGGERALIAEARYREITQQIAPADATLIRLICDASAGVPSVAENAIDFSSLNDSGEKKPPDLKSRLSNTDSRRLSTILMLCAAAVAIWLSLFEIKKAEFEVSRLHAQVAEQKRQTELAVTQIAATALATGDYGELQDALSSLSTRGYTDSISVTNTASRVVAFANAKTGVRVGDVISPSAAHQIVDVAFRDKVLGKIVFANDAGSDLKIMALRMIRYGLLFLLFATLLAVFLRWVPFSRQSR